ncbi:DUF4350 domain-containing protein [Terriglobus sp. TAA 43]|uniref:DUF4350 domain-containing protein n=1 Tax=Terriglobus sp. TAA 43 TaxID=278961 RepID=UPI000645FDE9|nr:DUF4350 domain-containing protein [Terriglobus sp. TAA 43]
MKSPNADRRTVLWVLGVMMLLVMLTAIFAPATSDDDKMPTTYNPGAAGWKGAFLLLPRLGYSVRRSDVSASMLDQVDAIHTTYVLAAPNAPAEDVQKRDYDSVERFLRRGGRVIATGSGGALFLPGGRSGKPTQFVGNLCNAVPEGNSDLAQTGSFSLYDAAPWNALEPLARVDARCGADAVLVHREYPHGGAMVYLASSEPFSNRGLKQDQSLHLLLLAVGPASGEGHRAVIFDEFYRGEQASPSDYLHGLPLRSLVAQASLVLLLLLFTYTRRSGPIREPLMVPRTSPLEFVESMGALYERAGVSKPATDGAHRRLTRFLISMCGVPSDMADSSQRTADFIGQRFGGSQGSLSTLLDRLQAARYETLRPRDALALVREADAEIERLQIMMKSSQSQPLVQEMK